MAYDLIKISALPAATPDESQEIVVGVGDYAKRINYGDVKADMVGTEPLYTTDTEPYLMRQTAHTGVVGKCALNKLVGGSLGWNQIVQASNGSTSSNGITYTYSSTGTVTVSGTASANSAFNYTPAHNGHENHVMFIKGCPQGGSATTYFGKEGYTSGTVYDTGDGCIIKKGSDTRALYQINVLSGTVISSAITFKPQIFDLTQMFGSTIADYVYSLEQATSGSGIAWLSRYIDLTSYHAYDAGSIQSVQATAHVTKDADDNVIGNYPLGSDTLRGIPQLVSNKLSYDGDEKYPDGTIKRKYGSRAYQSGDTSDGATMITDGTTTVYKLATPTTESSTSYQKIQTIDADGTESFTTSSPVPVGHETQTPDNILAALGWLGE